MFERYTEKARRVIFFARYEASTFGSDYIEPEFLLLGIVRETKGITRWFRKGESLQKLREEIEKSIDLKEKISTSVDLPLSDEAVNVLTYAAEEAADMGHPKIGSEHLFLGLLHDPNSRVAKMLARRGVDVNTVRATLAQEGVTSESRLGAGAISHSRPSVEIEMVFEDGKKMQPFWPFRMPAEGESVTIEGASGETTRYIVDRVEWVVTAASDKPSDLTKILIHVREAGKTA
jgi:ATP-dependent Clp protease ATP-binding subunit ClpA